MILLHLLDQNLYNQNGGQFLSSLQIILLSVPTGAQLDIYNQLQRQPETMLTLQLLKT